MLKNWLIRTKSNHILGPVSKAKVIELYKNGSVKADDEFCSGNGYWFFVKEKALVDRYLLGEEIQEFNPISEANDVLNVENSATAVINLNELQAKVKVEVKAEVKAQETEEIKLPTNDDLDYPDMGPVITKSEVQAEKLPPPPPPPSEISNPKIIQMKPREPIAEKKNEKVEITPPKRKEVPLKKKPEHPPAMKAPAEQASKLRMIIIVLIGIVIFAVIYQKFIVKKKLKATSIFIENASAQESSSQDLKKKYLNFKI
jgi:hypothetical protein